jgi:hypothetical protein
MRRLGAWKWELALLLGLSTAAAVAADRGIVRPDAEPKKDEAKAGWLRRWFKGDEEPELPRTEVRKADKPAPQPEARPQVEEAALQRQREEAALYRRLAVCDELNRIALETRDEELIRKASQLTQRVMAAYSQRTAHLPVSHASFESDEKILEKHLGAGTAAVPGQAGSPPYSIRGRDETPQTAARGEDEE